MLPFLQTIAEAYASRFRSPDVPAPEDWCFVFPNKRAGTFFLKYLRECVPEGIMAPEVTTISDLTASLSGRLINSRIDLIFLLYNCYCDLMSPGIDPADREKVLPFDAFRKWGETVLRDFNEVDMQNVDPEEIFKNVADFKRISSSFLTDEQRRVMEEYFGYSAPDYDDESFWIDFDKEEKPSGDSSGIRKKFIRLWKVLTPLYIRFKEDMQKRGLISSGGAYRLALENLRDAADADDDGEALRRLLPWKKMVMVGFNALSRSERELFAELKRLPSPGDSDDPLADFIWDATGPVLKDVRNSAGRFVAINRKNFPSPEWIRPWLQKSEADGFPEMEMISAPSKVMQVKIATRVINDMRLSGEVDEKSFEDARVALVVPDESLLLPLLYSMPPDIGEINLTMGYPLKLTSVTSFLRLLRQLQLASRDSKDYRGYSFEMMRDLLAHPFAHTVFSTRLINRFIADKERRHVNVIRETDLPELGENAVRLLRPLPKDADSEMVIGYLDEVLRILGEALTSESASSHNADLLKDSLELRHIEAWRDALRVFADSIEEYQVKLSVPATLLEAYRLLQAEIVPFEGEPLRGLQIMGMLETRALDFDNLVIIGLNDRTIPGRMRQRSFIPNVIRRGFGMPPNTYQEDLFGYYFFRLISRAKKATFIFDSRVTGGNGGESRYLLQLRYLYARDRVRQIESRFSLSGREEVAVGAEKTPFVKSSLLRFFDPEYRTSPTTGRKSRKNFTASLLKKYTACPMKFYYEGVLDLKDDPAPSPSVDPITMGNIVHNVMEELYVPDPAQRARWLFPPVAVTPGDIEEMLSEEGQARIKRMVHRALNRDHYHKADDRLDDPLQVDTEIIRESILIYIKGILEFDLPNAPFHIYGTEIRDNLEYPLPDGRMLNIEYALDRVDDIGCSSPTTDLIHPQKLRIVDYKTGGSHIESPGIDHLFEPDYKKDNLLQLLMYARLARNDTALAGLQELRFAPVIYPVGRFKTRDLKKQMIPRIGGKFVDDDRMPVPASGFLTSEASLPSDPEGADLNEIPQKEIPLIDAFTAELDETLMQIFGNGDFEARIDPRRCAQCPFLSACSS